MLSLASIIKGVSAVVTMISLCVLFIIGTMIPSNIFSCPMLCLWTTGVASGSVCFFLDTNQRKDN